MENVLPLEVAVIGDIIGATENPTHSLSQYLNDFGRGPDKEFSFFTLAVSILGRVKAPFRRQHLPLHIGQRLCSDAFKEFITGGLVGLQVKLDELGIIVQHLFEMRDKPVLIYRISMETTPQGIIDSPPT